MLYDVADAAPANTRLNVVHLIRQAVKRFHTTGEKVVMGIKKQGVVKEFVNPYKDIRTWHVRRITHDAWKICEPERDGPQGKQKRCRPGAVHGDIGRVDGGQKVVCLQFFQDLFRPYAVRKHENAVIRDPCQQLEFLHPGQGLFEIGHLNSQRFAAEVSKLLMVVIVSVNAD